MLTSVNIEIAYKTILLCNNPGINFLELNVFIRELYNVLTKYFVSQYKDEQPKI